MHACMYVCMYVCMHVCMHACVYACMHARVHACMRARARARVCVCVCAGAWCEYAWNFEVCMSVLPAACARNAGYARADDVDADVNPLARTAVYTGICTDIILLYRMVFTLYRMVFTLHRLVFTDVPDRPPSLMARVLRQRVAGGAADEPTNHVPIQTTSPHKSRPHTHHVHKKIATDLAGESIRSGRMYVSSCSSG